MLIDPRCHLLRRGAMNGATRPQKSGVPESNVYGTRKLHGTVINGSVSHFSQRVESGLRSISVVTETRQFREVRRRFQCYRNGLVRRSHFSRLKSAMDFRRPARVNRFGTAPELMIPTSRRITMRLNLWSKPGNALGAGATFVRPEGNMVALATSRPVVAWLGHDAAVCTVNRKGS